MPKKGQIRNLTGQKFGKWTVLQFGEIKSGKFYYWECVCDCGTKRSVMSNHLKSQRSQSCGCSAPRGKDHGSFKHGESNSPEFKAWLQMLTRCNNRSANSWPDYGGRGITVCERWATDFSSFLEDMGRKPSSSHSLDRIDVNQGYFPENCRWADTKQQARNTRRTRWVTYLGREMSLAEACELSGVKYASANERLNSGRHWMGAAHGL